MTSSNKPASETSSAKVPEVAAAADGFTPVTTDEGKLNQLIAYLEEHVSAYGFMGVPVPWEGTPAEVAEARREVNARAARMPDAIVHASMLVLGSAVNHTLPFVAYGMGNVDAVDQVIGGVPCTVMIPKNPTGAVVVGAHGGAWWMGDGDCRTNSFGPDAAALAARSGAIVIDVDYRLAPEYKMPAAAEDIAAVAKAVFDGSADLKLSGGGLKAPLVLWGISSGGHSCVAAIDLIPADLPVALLLNAPAVDARQAPEAMLRGAFGDAPADSKLVSPAIHPVTRKLRVHVQQNTKDGVVAPADEYLARVREAGGEASSSSFLATHSVATPTVQRERITDAARFILEVTGTERELPADATGEYDKDAVDRANEASWRRV